MNKLIVVGSSIQPGEGKFSYSNTRSSFSTEERFRQTVFTINSLRNSIPDAKIMVVDSSDDYMQYYAQLAFIKNVEYIPLKTISYEESIETLEEIKRLDALKGRVNKLLGREVIK